MMISTSVQSPNIIFENCWSKQNNLYIYYFLILVKSIFFLNLFMCCYVFFFVVYLHYIFFSIDVTWIFVIIVYFMHHCQKTRNYLFCILKKTFSVNVCMNSSVFMCTLYCGLFWNYLLTKCIVFYFIFCVW